jgi:hypothetical protein
MSKVITTTAPIAIEYLKEYFADKETAYVIDYANSELKGEKLLVYLGNLDLPADIKFETSEDLEEMVLAYASSTFIVNIKSLEFAMLNLLLKNEIGFPLTDELQVLLDHWSIRIRSLLLYNLHTVNLEEFNTFVDAATKDDTDSLVGVNFVSLLKYEELGNIIVGDDNNLDECINYTKYFNDYMFKGKNLYSYWANPNNILFLQTWAVASGERQNILAENNELAKQEN